MMYNRRVISIAAETAAKERYCWPTTPDWTVKAHTNPHKAGPKARIKAAIVFPAAGHKTHDKFARLPACELSLTNQIRIRARRPPLQMPQSILYTRTAKKPTSMLTCAIDGANLSGRRAQVDHDHGGSHARLACHGAQRQSTCERQLPPHHPAPWRTFWHMFKRMPCTRRP